MRSSLSDPEQIDGGFAAGVLAYVIKTAQPEDLASAVRQVLEHSAFFAGRQDAVKGETPAPHQRKAGRSPSKRWRSFASSPRGI